MLLIGNRTVSAKMSAVISHMIRITLGSILRSTCKISELATVLFITKQMKEAIIAPTDEAVTEVKSI